MPVYPHATFIPWKRYDRHPQTGYANFYQGTNHPIAVVQHIQQGWKSTYDNWARRGHFRAAVHFSVGRDGSVSQYLDFDDGGYHAGITGWKAANYPPKWDLWKGQNVNVNQYTLGVEHEGFFDQIFPETGTPLTLPQMESSRDLNWWLAGELNIPVDEEHFPPHAAIDRRDRPNDFAVPAARRIYYRFLKQERLEQDMAELESLRAEVETFQARNDILNDVMVIQRDLARAINGSHPHAWRVHHALREAGLLIEPEYQGDYAGYVDAD